MAHTKLPLHPCIIYQIKILSAVSSTWLKHVGEKFQKPLQTDQIQKYWCGDFLTFLLPTHGPTSPQCWMGICQNCGFIQGQQKWWVWEKSKLTAAVTGEMAFRPIRKVWDSWLVRCKIKSCIWFFTAVSQQHFNQTWRPIHQVKADPGWLLEGKDHQNLQIQSFGPCSHLSHVPRRTSWVNDAEDNTSLCAMVLFSKGCNESPSNRRNKEVACSAQLTEHWWMPTCRADMSPPWDHKSFVHPMNRTS